MKARPATVLQLCLLAAAMFCAPARASDESVFTMDLPFDAAQPLPSWMHGAPVSAPGSGARIAFSLSPPSGRDLLIHLVFDETVASTLKVEWLRDGQSTTEVLAENLGEGLGVPNQRPLLVSASRLGGNGTLIIQGGANLNVNRVKFEWVSERTMLASSSHYVPVVVTASRLTLAEAEVDGSAHPALADEWRDRIVRAALTEKAESLTSSLELMATLEQAPTMARIEASVAGVYLDQEVWLVINGQEIGPLAIEVPTLEDPGHLGLPGRGVEFAGWRRASAHIPPPVLLPGENSILLELRSPLNSGYHNSTFVRDAILELAYPPPPREPDLSMPVTDVPTGEIEVDDSLPLSPLATPLPGTGDVLSDFWNGGTSSTNSASSTDSTSSTNSTSSTDAL